MIVVYIISILIFISGFIYLLNKIKQLEKLLAINTNILTMHLNHEIDVSKK